MNMGRCIYLFEWVLLSSSDKYPKMKLLDHMVVLGEGHGTPLQSSCLENPMDRGAWRATVHRVAKSQTRLKQLSVHAHMVVLVLM